MGFLRWLRGAGGRREEEDAPPSGPLKLLPVINRDYCSGCNLCVEACDNGCLELVWDFATFKHPLECGSDGKCAEACSEGLIRMEWIPLPRDTGGGEARPAPGSVPAPGLRPVD